MTPRDPHNRHARPNSPAMQFAIAVLLTAFTVMLLVSLVRGLW